MAEREKSAATLQLELELGRTELQTKLDVLDFETAACRTRQLELDDAKQKVEKRQRELDGREATLYNEQERNSRQQASIATGHAMMGLSMAPITGKLMAELLSGEPPSIDISPLRPDRYR